MSQVCYPSVLDDFTVSIEGWNPIDLQFCDVIPQTLRLTGLSASVAVGVGALSKPSCGSLSLTTLAPIIDILNLDTLTGVLKLKTNQVLFGKASPSFPVIESGSNLVYAGNKGVIGPVDAGSNPMIDASG